MVIINIHSKAKVVIFGYQPIIIPLPSAELHRSDVIHHAAYIRTGCRLRRLHLNTPPEENGALIFICRIIQVADMWQNQVL